MRLGRVRSQQHHGNRGRDRRAHQLRGDKTGDVIDRRTRRIVATLRDETGAQVQSEKLLEIDFDHGKPTRNGEQSGVGQNR